MKKTLFEVKSGVELSFADFKDFGAHIFNNVIENMKGREDIIHLINFEGFLKNQPAVICGAGPSLKKHLKELKKLKKGSYLFG